MDDKNYGWRADPCVFNRLFCRLWIEVQIESLQKAIYNGISFEMIVRLLVLF